MPREFPTDRCSVIASDIIAEHFATDHHKIFIPSEHLLDSVPKAVSAMAEPMVSRDCTAFFLLSEQVAKHVKVVQSGQGADEVFGGYHWYPPLMESNDPVGDYARVFFDQDHTALAEAMNPGLVDEDFSRSFIEAHFAQPGADRAIDMALRTDSTIMLVRDALNSARARERNLFRKSYLDTLFAAPDQHLTPLRGSRLWQAAVLEMWLQTYCL